MRALPWSIGLSALMMTILWKQNTEKDDTQIDPKILEEVITEHFETKMTKEDINYEAMQIVLNLIKNKQLASVKQFMRQYNDTVFNELMYILFERAWEKMTKAVLKKWTPPFFPFRWHTFPLVNLFSKSLE